MLAGLDLDGAVAACGLDELLDGPAGGVLDDAGHGQGGEHDGQVRVDGLAGAVIDRPGGEVGLGHAEALLDLEESVVGADDELGARVGQVGDIALDPGQGSGLDLQLAVHRLRGVGQRDEPVPLHGGLAGHGLLGLGDLGVDALEGPPGVVRGVLVVDDLVTGLAAGGRGPGLGEHVPIGDGFAGVLAQPLSDLVGDVGCAGAEDERESFGLDGLLVRVREHPGVGHDLNRPGDVGGS